MAQTVSNDALWEKLSEIEKKLDQLSVIQKSEQSHPSQEETLASIDEKILRIGLSNDSNLTANKQNFTMLAENMIKILNIVARIRKQQRASVEVKEEDKKDFFTLWFLKVRKTSLVIAILGLLVFVLTLFCMKQQNDYSFLINSYQKGKLMKLNQVETDSLKNTIVYPQ